MPNAFPVTERILRQLDEWLSELAAPLLPLKKVPAGPPEANGFRWAFREETERALVIGKSVRMISAIRAAFIWLSDRVWNPSSDGVGLRERDNFNNRRRQKR